MKKFAVILLFLCFPLLLPAQEKIYTKKMKLADFPQKTTRVVIEDNPVCKALQEEMPMRWIFSPFEFCTKEQYLAQKKSSDYSFITLEAREGFLWLTLSKGGQEKGKGTDPRLEAMEILSFPVSPAAGPYTEVIQYLPGYLDIMQRFISDAYESDGVAYMGLKAYGKIPGGKKTVFKGEEALKAFAEKRENGVAAIQVIPSDPSNHSTVWNYLIGTDESHYPYRVSKSKWKNR